MYIMVKNLNKGEGMEVQGLIINKDLSNFKPGQALLMIQNKSGKDIGFLNIQNSNLIESIKRIFKTPQRIRILIETEKPWKEETVKEGKE